MGRKTDSELIRAELKITCISDPREYHLIEGEELTYIWLHVLGDLAPCLYNGNLILYIGLPLCNRVERVATSPTPIQVPLIIHKLFMISADPTPS